MTLLHIFLIFDNEHMKLAKWIKQRLGKAGLILLLRLTVALFQGSNCILDMLPSIIDIVNYNTRTITKLKLPDVPIN